MGNKWHSRWEVVVSEPCVEGLLNALSAAEVDIQAPRLIDEVTLYLEIPYGQMSRARRVMEARGCELRLCRPLADGSRNTAGAKIRALLCRCPGTPELRLLSGSAGRPDAGPLAPQP